MGAITSDGDPSEERRAALLASSLGCSTLVDVLGQTPNGSLVMELLTDYRVLSQPPSLESCSRDVYDPSSATDITPEAAARMVGDLLHTMTSLHERGLCHGDFYGHNILVSTREAGRVWLTDFGAAFFYDRRGECGAAIEVVERRAFGILVEEVADLVTVGGGLRTVELLKEFADLCEKLPFVALCKRWSELKLDIA